MTKAFYPGNSKDTGLAGCRALQRPRPQCMGASLARSEGPKISIIVDAYVAR